MSDEYLWDRSGPPDPEVERLETMLGRLRSTTRVPEVPAEVRLRSWRPASAGPGEVRLRADTTTLTFRYLAPMLAAAAAIVLMIGSTWQSTRRAGSWDVARVDGQPRI